MELIKIGTLVKGNEAIKNIPQLIKHGFESFSLTFWQTTGDIDLPETGKRLKDILDNEGISMSSLSIFGNPLTGEGNNNDSLASWERLIDTAHYFGTDLVTGFTGRIPDISIDKSIPRFKEVFGELNKRACDRGVKIAFENCNMGGTWQKGDWNIAHGPTAWEMMFDAIPSDNIGLQWEPCHQLVGLVDPLPQLRKWVNKVFNVHGKDATIAWDIVKEYGINGPKQFAWHRTPGFGDTNWTDLISILMQAGYTGSIDIEGWHDPVYNQNLEITGQVSGLNYLKRCRGGSFIENPA